MKRRITRRSLANFVRYHPEVIITLPACIFILYDGIVMFLRDEFSIPSRSVCYTGFFGRVLSSLFIVGGLYGLHALYDLFWEHTKEDEQVSRNIWGQSFLVGVFPVMFVISGLLLPSGDIGNLPQFAVFLPLFLCGAVAMFVSVKYNAVLRRTKIVLGVIYTLAVIALVFSRMMAR